MHIKHLGTDQYDYGSVIKFLTHHIMPASPDINLDAFVAHLKMAYEDSSGMLNGGSSAESSADALASALGYASEGTQMMHPHAPIQLKHNIYIYIYIYSP